MVSIPNVSTEAFLSLFGGEMQWFRCFFDDKKGASATFNGLRDFSSISNELERLNREGSGIYFIPNETNGIAGDDANIISVRAFYVDIDNAPIDPVLATGVNPHAIVRTSIGKYQVYWLVDGLPVNEFKAHQQALITRFNSDPLVCNPSRVMRLPNFYHLKDRNDPQLVKLVSFNPELRRYSPGEIINGLGLDEGMIRKAVEGGEYDDNKAKTPFVLPDIILKSGGENYAGRDATMWNYLCSLQAKGYSEEEMKILAAEVNETRCKPPLDQSIIDEKIKRITELYPKGVKNNEKFSLSAKFFDPNAWAEDLKKQARLIFDGEFFKFNGKYYETVSENDLKYDIRDATNWKSKIRHTSEILEALKIKCGRNIPERDPKGLLCLRNGVFDFGAGTKNPHSEEFFVTHIVDIDYDEYAKSPLWLQTLEEILPDYDSRVLLQKYAGYSLTTDVSHQKCLFMLGTGANGKSTIIEVIQALIGESNFSSLKLDELSEKFAVCELEGKLANFSPENRTSHIRNEATFKGLVDGSHTSVDVKFKGRLNFKPYAKLWIASNPLPASRDTTKGFIRRFLFLKFPVEFEYSSSKTDLNRAAKIIKGEMSGVLNWALEGLRMLNQQGFEPFPKCHHEIFEETCSVINPRIDFIRSSLVESKREDAKIMLVDILAEYNLFASTHGHHTVSIGKLKADLEQHAPYIRFTKPQNLWRCHNVLLKKNVNPLDDDESTDD